MGRSGRSTAPTIGDPFCFEAPIERHAVGRGRQLWYTVLFLPPHMEAELPFADHPRLRVEGEVAEHPIQGAWLPTGDGRHYLIVSPRLLKSSRVKVGDVVEMRFRVADQEAVDVPEELERALGRSAKARRAWDALTPGKRRGLAYRVQAARQAATRERRVAEVIAALSAA